MTTSLIKENKKWSILLKILIVGILWINLRVFIGSLGLINIIKKEMKKKNIVDIKLEIFLNFEFFFLGSFLLYLVDHICEGNNIEIMTEMDKTKKRGTVNDRKFGNFFY